MEQSATYQSVTDAEAPWQNGRAERRGQWIQGLLEKECESNFIRNAEELELLSCELTAAKDRYLHRGGFSPFQLVYGHNPRLPHKLLSDDPLDRIGLEDLSAPMDADTVADEFSREVQIRHRAREKLFSDSRRKITDASASAMHCDRRFQQGQWVYVYRRAPQFRTASKHGGLQRDRWVGPGVVVLQKGNTVWVGMRSRLWKCSSEQIRLATSTEAMGAELVSQGGMGSLIQQVARGGHNSGVDVAREGSPPENAWEDRVARDTSGAAPASGVPTTRVGPIGTPTANRHQVDTRVTFRQDPEVVLIPEDDVHQIQPPPGLERTAVDPMNNETPPQSFVKTDHLDGAAVRASELIKEAICQQ